MDSRTHAPDSASEDRLPEEQLLFVGHPARVRSIRDLLSAVGAVALALIVIETPLLDATMGVRLAAGCAAVLAAGAAGWVALEWKRRRVHYRITTQRIVIERGLFSKRVEPIDLYRITDFAVELPFGQRLVGTGNLVLESLDTSSPEVRLDGLRTDVRGLYENLRRATELERRRRGVRLIDGDPHSNHG